MHKYGFHVNRTGEDVFDAIRRIKPAVIKTLEHDVGFWKRVRAIHPDVFLIGRLFVDRNEQDRFVENPAARGRAFAERILALECNRTTVNGRPLFDAWESYNEVMGEGAEDWRKRAYDEFQVAFGQRMQAAGFEPIAMNFGTGNMLGRDFLQFFRGTLETYRYLGFHEYDWPTLWRLHRKNIEETNEGGMWLALRYRRIMNEVRAVYPNRHTVIITECGLTMGVVGGDDVGPWNRVQPVTEESYWQSLLWYNEELMKDDYVKAACLFVVGAVTPWESFEHLGGIIDRLERFQREQGGSPTPRPEEPASEEPAQPDPRLVNALFAEGARRQALSLNPQAALQKRIFADGFVPNSSEFEVVVDGVRYVAQQAEHLGTGEVRAYYVPFGDWENVRYVTRAEPRGRPVTPRGGALIEAGAPALPAALAVPHVRTPFSPPQRGFRFPNSFEVNLQFRLPLAGTIDLGRVIYGLCGGMCFSALDFYYAGLPVPDETEIPTRGSELYDHLLKRQLDSLPPPSMPLRLFEWMLLSPAQVWRRVATTEFPKLRRRLDRGDPTVLCLIRARGFDDPAKNHQVVATAYAYDEETKTAVIWLYDPNHPGEEPTLEISLANPQEGIRGRQSTGEPLYGFFVLDYTPRTPSGRAQGVPPPSARGRGLMGGRPSLRRGHRTRTKPETSEEKG